MGWHARLENQVVALLTRYRKDGMTVTEVGVDRGQTSQAILERCPFVSLLVMVDSWTAHDEDTVYAKSGDGKATRAQEEATAAMREAETRTEAYSARRLMHQMASTQAARMMVDDAMDAVFIDGDHTYEGVRSDLQSWWPKLREGGLMFGHDYGHPRDKRGIFGVKRAVDEFAAEHGLTAKVDEGTTVWRYEKEPTDAP